MVSKCKFGFIQEEVQPDSTTCKQLWDSALYENIGEGKVYDYKGDEGYGSLISPDELSDIPSNCGILGLGKTYFTRGELKSACDAYLKSDEVQTDPKKFYKSKIDYTTHWRFASEIFNRKKSINNKAVSSCTPPGGHYATVCKEVEVTQSAEKDSCYLLAECPKIDGSWKSTFVNYEEGDTFMSVDGVLKHEDSLVSFAKFDFNYGGMPYMTSGVQSQIINDVDSAQKCFEASRRYDDRNPALAWSYKSAKHPIVNERRECTLYTNGFNPKPRPSDFLVQENQITSSDFLCNKYYCPEGVDFDKDMIIGCLNPYGKVIDGCGSSSASLSSVNFSSDVGPGDEPYNSDNFSSDVGGEPYNSDNFSSDVWLGGELPYNV